MRTLAILLFATATLHADDANPVRIASGVSGHIHPAICKSKKGTIVIVFSQADFKDLRVTRSTDDGKTWSKPEPLPPTESLSIYPGALTALADGRIVHAWNTWYKDAEAKDKSRYVQYSISGDEGKTWSEAKSLAKNPMTPSILRHPFVELSPTEWLFSLSDRAVILDPTTGKETPFDAGRKHGQVPMVRTPKGTIVAGDGQRTSDMGKTWEKLGKFPKLAENGWRFDLAVLKNGWLIAGEVIGPGTGGDRWHFVVSTDDGATWNFDKPYEFYNPGRPIGGRACPRTISLDDATIGTVYYDVDARQEGGPGVFFLRTPLAKLLRK